MSGDKTPTALGEHGVLAKPIHEYRLDKFKAEIEDPDVWVVGPLDRREAAALCGDAYHWRAMYQDALQQALDNQREVERLRQALSDVERAS